MDRAPEAPRLVVAIGGAGDLGTSSGEYDDPVARRRNSPVLYELLGSATTGSVVSNMAAPPAEGGPLAQRRTVRVPIGWIWLSAVVALSLMALSYQFGRSNGERAGFARGQELMIDRDALARLTRETPDPARRADSEPATHDRASAPQHGRSQESGARPDDRNVSRVVDPRTRGRNYLVIARPSAEEAEKLVAFLRSHGLDAAAVPDDNPRFRKVVALPGFPAGTGRSSDQVRALENRVKALGQSWKAAARGNRDFNDAYLELHR